MPGSRPDEAAWTRSTDDDVTSGLPNDVTGSWLTLAMGHGQTVILGYVVTSWSGASHPGYRLTLPL